MEMSDVLTTDENLPNEAVRERIKVLILRLWPEQTLNYELQHASAKGDNYLGVVWRICIGEASSHSLVLKVPPQNSVRRKQFFARPCFLREALAYEHFLPLTQRFQEEQNVPEAERFVHYARCFDSCDTECNECIFLEDLRCSGYALYDRFCTLPVTHVRLVMRAYAKLHAISLALKCRQPQRLAPFQQIVDIFEQRKNDVALAEYFEQLKVNTLDSLRSVEDAIYVRRLVAYFARGSFFELLLPLISGSNCEPYAVVCHGDCWNNNMMYRQQPMDVRLIDWQLMRYASPVTDLAYFFYTCTTQEFRIKHFEQMLLFYYDELSQQLSRLGASAQQLFPRAAFDQQLRQKFAVGLLLAMMVLPIVTMRGDDVPDLQAISEMIEAGGTTNLEDSGFLGAGNKAEYKRRMRGVIIDCANWNYI